MGKVLSGKLSCPCDSVTGLVIFFLLQNVQIARLGRSAEEEMKKKKERKKNGKQTVHYLRETRLSPLHKTSLPSATKDRQLGKGKVIG